MSSNVPGMEKHGRTLRAWQLAILRFAVTFDNADKLAVLMIAAELDGTFRPRQPPVEVVIALELPARTKSGATGRGAAEDELFPAFRSGTTHIVIFRPVSPGRSIPG